MRGNATKRTAANQAHPCPVCGDVKKCSTGEDGLIFCRRRKGDQDGFFCIGPSKKDPQWTLYRRNDDPLLLKNQASGQAGGRQKGRKEGGGENQRAAELLLQAQKFRSQLSPQARQHLADLLGLPNHALDAIPLLGYHPSSHRGPCWTIPHHDGRGQLVGLQYRFADGDKPMRKGSACGLILSEGWDQGDGPLYLVEGASCTLALAALGLPAIGRSNNTAGAEQLSQLLAGHLHREIVVMGETDPNWKDGTWPGREGAIKLAESLSRTLNRKVIWALPPGGAKDCREWFQEQRLKDVEADMLERAGCEFTQALRPQAIAPKLSAQEDSLYTVTLDNVKDEVIRWLIPDYIPQSTLAVLAGDGSMGKSFLTLSIAASLSRGQPCFGLDYPPYEPVESLIFNREDGMGRTLKPRLRTLGADFRKIHVVSSVKTKGGKDRAFSLADLGVLRAFLDDHPAVKFIVIDPVDSYVGGSGVDDFRAASLRDGILDPLRDIALQTGAFIWMILHLNKSSSPNATNRIANSKAYFTGSRVAYMAFREPGSEHNRVFTCEKFNDAPIPSSLLYRITSADKPLAESVLEGMKGELPDDDLAAYRRQLAYCSWQGFSDLDGNACCAAEQAMEQDDGLDPERAAKWLRGYLSTGPQSAADCVEAGNEAIGLGQDMRWWREKVLRRRIAGKTFKGGFSEGWMWALPGEARQAVSTPFDSEETEETEGAEETEETEG